MWRHTYETAAILVCSTEFAVKTSVPPYEAREALYAESVMKQTTRGAEPHLANHGQNLMVNGSGLPPSAMSFKK